jgi:hypothetical protein
MLKALSLTFECHITQKLGKELKVGEKRRKNSRRKLQIKL